MSEGTWRIVFRFNGRLSGRTAVETTCDDRKQVQDRLDELEKDAVRANGAIYVVGWSVDWVEAELEGEEPQ